LARESAAAGKAPTRTGAGCFAESFQAPETGSFFKDEWLRPYMNAPDRKTLVTYGGSDFAVTADGGDYTCHIVIGIDPEDRPWLLDLWRGQWTHGSYYKRCRSKTGRASRRRSAFSPSDRAMRSETTHCLHGKLSERQLRRCNAAS
jgi:hypothetical protein